MQDRYLFRGKCPSDGKWHEGSLVYGAIYASGQCMHIVRNGTVGTEAELCTRLNIVDPATIGQCTGLKDKNGKLIFEGDVLSLGGQATNRIVKWNVRRHGWTLQNARYMVCFTDIDKSDYEFYEIFGNVHDNPELLEVQND